MSMSSRVNRSPATVSPSFPMLQGSAPGSCFGSHKSFASSSQSSWRQRLSRACLTRECLPSRKNSRLPGILHWALPAGKVRLDSERIRSGAYRVAMEQGCPTVGRMLREDEEAPFLAALSLEPENRDGRLPLEVVSTGLPYLIVPVTPHGLARARICMADFEGLLEKIGAKFVYVFDAEGREGRTWDNAGAMEDVATGSAAGPTSAYLVRHGVADAEKPFVLRQGRFVGRPSEIRVEVTGSADLPASVTVAGDVQMVGTGVIEAALPPEM